MNHVRDMFCNIINDEIKATVFVIIKICIIKQ